jgi:hypothetical protein
MWAEEIAELAPPACARRRVGGAASVERQRAKGKLTVRDRMNDWSDAGSWREVGELTGRTTYAEDGSVAGFTATNTVLGGRGSAGCRRWSSATTSPSVAVRPTPIGAAKQVYAEQMAGESGMPLVRLLDGTGGGGTVESLLDLGRTYVPWNPGLGRGRREPRRIPVIAVALGPVAGLGAARLVTSHLSIMVRGRSQVFIAGPAVVAAGMGEEVDKEALGGWRPTARAGTVDLVVDSEDEALALVRRLLTYLPQRVGSAAPRGPAAAAEPTRRCATRCRATGAPRTTCAQSSSGSSTRPACSSWAATSPASTDHRAGPAGRLAGRGAGERSAGLRRRPDRRRLGQVDPLRRPRRAQHHACLEPARVGAARRPRYLAPTGTSRQSTGTPRNRRRGTGGHKIPARRPDKRAHDSAAI